MIPLSFITRSTEEIGHITDKKIMPINIAKMNDDHMVIRRRYLANKYMITVKMT